MENEQGIFTTLNNKLNTLWQEDTAKGRHSARTQSAPKRSVRERTGTFLSAHRWDLLFVLVMGCLLFGLSWVLPFNEAPDEAMRYMIPEYIYRHGTLPAGYDPEVINEIWGISYAYHPILPYIFGGYLMKLVGIFNDSEKALLMAARFINVLVGMGFYWYVVQIAKKLFCRPMFRAFFIALLALLPQLLYLFTYVNTDAIALFSSAMIIYYWLRGIESRWDRSSCTGLAVGVAVCALSYFNAYGYALCSILLFIGTLIVFYRKKGAKRCTEIILKRGLYITAIVFALCGWWFIRSAILYDGDFLGMSVGDKYAEIYAMEDFKPSVKTSLSEDGVALSDMLTGEEDGYSWIITTYRSTIGCFGYMQYYLGMDIYEIHISLFGLGVIGIGIHCVLYLWERIRKKNRILLTYENCRMQTGNFLLLQGAFVCSIIIPILLSVYYSYCSDYQAQGRYIMAMIIPVMYFTAAGVERAYTLVFRKWLVPFMMIPLFYAVLHVFLSAFLTTYLPTFVPELASWGTRNVPWLSNIDLLARMLKMLLPG